MLAAPVAMSGLRFGNLVRGRHRRNGACPSTCGAGRGKHSTRVSVFWDDETQAADRRYRCDAYAELLHLPGHQRRGQIRAATSPLRKPRCPWLRKTRPCSRRLLTWLRRGRNRGYGHLVQSEENERCYRLKATEYPTAVPQRKRQFQSRVLQPKIDSTRARWTMDAPDGWTVAGDNQPRTLRLVRLWPLPPTR